MPGLEATAVVVSCEPAGRRRVRLVLDVRLDGELPYRVQGEWRARGDIAEGQQLPVRVDSGDRSRIAIDWDAPRPLSAPAPAAPAPPPAPPATAHDRAVQVGRQAQHRQAALKRASAVRAGELKREEFDRSVQAELESGRLHPADAAAVRAYLDA